MKWIAILLLLLPVSAYSQPEILINRLLADRLSIRAGDFVEIAPTGDMKNAEQFRVAGIYEEKADPYQVPLRHSQIKMHLTDLESLMGRYDQVDLISLQLAKNTDARKLVARLNAEAIGFTAYSANELASRTSATFEVVSRFHKAIAFITMVAGAIFIFALIVLRVEDQRKNLAILTITGISKRTILQSLLLESTLFAFLASLMGAVIGQIAAAIVNAYYQHYYATTLIFAQVSGHILIQAMSISFFLGIAAGTFSWIRLRHLPVLEELGR